MSFYSRLVEKVSKGEQSLLYKNGRFFEENMKKSDITSEEIFESLRLKCQLKSLDTIEEVFMEKSGELSFVKKSTE